MASQYCTFRVERHWFGVPVCEVAEVIQNLPSTQVPLAGTTVDGLINLRGEIVTTIDLKDCLGLAKSGDDAPALHVIVTTGDGRLSLCVDEIGDVVPVADTDMRATSAAIPNDVKNLVLEAIGLEDRLLLLMDVRRLREQLGQKI